MKKNQRRERAHEILRAGPVSEGHRVGPAPYEQSEAVWLEAEVDPQGAWIAFVQLMPSDNGPVISELRIFPSQKRRGVHPANRPYGEWTRNADKIPTGGITSTLLRTVRVEQLRQEAARTLNQNLGSARSTIERRWPRMARSIERWTTPISPTSRTATLRPPGNRRTGEADCVYVETAAQYVALLHQGSRRPNTELAKRLGIKPPQVVTDRIKKARELLYLSDPPQPGVPGGVLTELGRQKLAECAEQERAARKGRGE